VSSDSEAESESSNTSSPTEGEVFENESCRLSRDTGVGALEFWAARTGEGAVDSLWGFVYAYGVDTRSVNMGGWAMSV
jgi:hypothetical protein